MRETYIKAAVVCLITGVVFFGVFQIFPVPIIQAFGVKSNGGLEFATRYFRVFMFMTIVNGLQPMSSGFFTSVGKARLGIITSLTRQILFLSPLIIILPLFMGIDGIMFAGPIADGAAVVIAMFFAVRFIRQMGEISLTEEDGLK